MAHLRPTARAARAVASGLVIVLTLTALGAAGPSSASALGTSTTSRSVRPADTDVSRAEAAALARRAVTDDDALAELRAIRAIDGRSVDLAAATADLGPDRATRLTALAAALGATGTPPGAREARETARDVLADRKFRSKPVPRPFKGLLEAMARPLRPVFRRIGGWFRPILDLPGGPFILFVLLVAGAAAVVALMIGRRSRAAVVRYGHGPGLVDPEADPAALDAAADAAEAAGDLQAAVRLRYEAGLVRLVRADRIELRPETTASDAARQVDLPVMHELTADFEQVVYGGRAATVADVDRARAGWAEVVGVGSRR